MIPKFRVYHKEEKKMLSNYLGFAITESGQLLIESFRGDESVMEQVESDNFIIMQSTGLKDKNGVEIYEGDILPSNYNVFSKGELKVQVVRFLDGGFRRLSVYQEWGPYGAYGETEIADWHDGGCLSEEEARKTKVLGNIYEHPELLEEEE